MPPDIRPDHLRMVRDILRKYAPGREVWAFGSRVKDCAGPTSDLDLCVVGSAPLPFEIIEHLSDAFSESDIPYAVDVVDWAGLSPSFRSIVERHKMAL